ncbi:hypothetical protein [Stenotrophomonas sp.]|uniref:hypothetical protein n=1 Tax=Stenotrophomonas sp. TaxID=69392 RepID=UPI0028AC6F38|nr:hypothetical protein [Stenotrophomonas sp.]
MLAKLLLPSSLLLISSFCASADERVSVGRCYAIPDTDAGRSPTLVCKAIFPELWSEPSAAERNVELTGYVAVVDDRPYLFASRDLYFYSGGAGGVALDLPAPERDRFTRMIQKDGIVTVAGRYYAGSRWGGADSIGTLEVIGRHYWMQERPGGPPLLPE